MSPSGAPVDRFAATAAATADSFEARYPNIAGWVQDGWIEMGRDDCGRAFVRALDIGGLVWEGDGPYAGLDAALTAILANGQVSPRA